MSDSYIKHGFLCQVYEPWVSFEGSEWGDCMSRLHAAYEIGLGSLWSDEELDAMESILHRWLEDAGLSFFFDEDGMYEQEVLEAQLRYPDAVENWKTHANGTWYSTNGGPEAFAEAEARAFDWMRPPPDADVSRVKRSKLEGQLEEIEKKAAKVREELAKLP